MNKTGSKCLLLYRELDCALILGEDLVKKKFVFNCKKL